ncbi:MAG: iron-containing alcohol dehydrogenase [Syntrophomonadaceae bacterium]|nr:iron-containing alcohol dehydrogenase [Syntrophomonadaceae bacterium]MDD4548794.1 iron-containing alcohol dehydrogenase [Syntrophomonadaceae bacterium]
MLNFNIQIPTRIRFGRGKIEDLGKEILNYGDKVLLVYGGGSIKRSGLYDQVVQIFQDNGITHVELSGVQPNPRISSVRQGVKLCKKHEVHLVLAVGGGSTIDCAKIIAAGAGYDGDPWDFFTRKAKIKYALPVGTVLTLAATGSEMNPSAVISNDDTKQKLGTGSPVLIPRFSILDPEYSFTVPPTQTAAGTVDIMSHIFEQYFSPTPGTFIQERLAEAMLKTCIHFGPIAIAQPGNYEARANLMWTSSLALNGLLSAGKLTDWATHDIEHEISAIYDVTHGLGLAILIPYWMQYILDEQTAPRLAEYARNVWEIEESEDIIAAQAGIKKTAEFFKSMNLASSLSEIGVESKHLAEIAQRATAKRTLGAFKKLEYQDVLNILQTAYGVVAP